MSEKMYGRIRLTKSNRFAKESRITQNDRLKKNQREKACSLHNELVQMDDKTGSGKDNKERNVTQNNRRHEVVENNGRPRLKRARHIN